MPSLPAWYGKLPGLGDFASRRMAPDFLELWDPWLAQGMLALRERKPTAWLDDYLVSPSWRFLLMPACLPGALGAQAWAGVLMPSVDKVGRYFPFTIVRRLAHPPNSLQGLQALWQELARCDELAADALNDDWNADRLEVELSASCPDLSEGPAPPVVADLRLIHGQLLELPNGLGGPEQLVGEALQQWVPHALGRSYWYTCASPSSARMQVCKGLPSCAGALLGLELKGDEGPAA